MEIKKLLRQSVLLFSVFLLACGCKTAAAAPHGLNEQQKSIVAVAACTARGELGLLQVALDEALDSGLTVNQVKEVLVQMYAYCGFPRSLNGLNTLISVLDRRREQGITDTMGPEASPLSPRRDRLAMGEKTQTALVGAPVSGRLYDFAPVIGVFLKEHLFCDIFARDILSWQERELATVGALAALGNVNAQLTSHLRVSMNTGLTKEQLQDCINVIGSKLGQTLGANAQQVFNAL